MGEISRPPVNSLLDKQPVSKTVGDSVTSLSGEVTNVDEKKNTMTMSVFTADNGEELSLVRMKLDGTGTLQTIVQGYRSVLHNGARDVSLLLNVQIRQVVHPASFPGAKDRGVRLTTLLHPAAKVKNE